MLTSKLFRAKSNFKKHLTSLLMIIFSVTWKAATRKNCGCKGAGKLLHNLFSIDFIRQFHQNPTLIGIEEKIGVHLLWPNFIAPRTTTTDQLLYICHPLNGHVTSSRITIRFQLHSTLRQFVHYWANKKIKSAIRLCSGQKLVAN